MDSEAKLDSYRKVGLDLVLSEVERHRFSGASSKCIIAFLGGIMGGAQEEYIKMFETKGAAEIMYSLADYLATHPSTPVQHKITKKSA